MNREDPRSVGHAIVRRWIELEISVVDRKRCSAQALRDEVLHVVQGFAGYREIGSILPDEPDESSLVVIRCKPELDSRGSGAARDDHRLLGPVKDGSEPVAEAREVRALKIQQVLTISALNPSDGRMHDAESSSEAYRPAPLDP